MRLHMGQGLKGFEGEHEVEFVIGEQFHQLIHLLVHDVDFYLRIQLYKSYQGLRKNSAEGVGDSNVERAGQHVP